MRITRSGSSLALHASVLDSFLGGTIPPAKTVRFDGVRGAVTVGTGFLARRKRTVPFGRILKIRHRISAPILRIDLDGGGHAYHRSVSAASEIRIELRDSSNVAIYAEVYDRGGNSKAVRDRILRIQEIADEVSRITGKPIAIDFEEVECTFDMADRKLLLSGDLLPPDLKGIALRFEQIDRLEVVETPTGYYSVTIRPRWGRGIRTTEGYDRTNFLSDTVAMIAARSDLFCSRLGKRPFPEGFSDVPNVPIRPGGWREVRPAIREAKAGRRSGS